MNTKLLWAGVFTLLSVNTVLFSQTYVQFSSEELYEANMAAKASGNVSSEDAIMTSTSSVDWTTEIFKSNVALDTQKAGIPMPSGKVSCINKIETNLPVLIKDPLLSLYIDDSKTINDMVLDGSITLEELTHIIEDSNSTPAYFERGSSTLKTEHSLNLSDIRKLLVKHNNPYTQTKPIETIATRQYTGIIIDARGSLNVHGEFVSSQVSPALFPKIWDENMTLLYERNMVNPETVKTKGMIKYGNSTNPSDYLDTVGKDPMWITAKKVYGINRVDPIISYEDYLRITTVDSNLDLLKEGKVVIILDKEKLMYNVSAPTKSTGYYLNYISLRRYLYENKVPDTVVKDAQSGIQITMQNLNFIADSAQLLPSEISRVAQIADSLKEILQTGDYTVLVEGHTADVNKPEGQMNLSIQRAQAIVNALIEQGLDAKLFTYKGYGGTKPIADNSTPEGRAENRRVEITVMPKASYVQRE